jgi:uncharacterized OsmC-like protein
MTSADDGAIHRFPVLKGCAMLEYDVIATRSDQHGSKARCKSAEILLDTDVNGRTDAFNPAELFLAAVAACMIKGIERVAPMIHFEFQSVEVRLHGVRQDSPPFMASISYQLIVDTDEDERRLDLLHQNIRKYGTISNTVAAATKLEGKIMRAPKF